MPSSFRKTIHFDVFSCFPLLQCPWRSPLHIINHEPLSDQPRQVNHHINTDCWKQSNFTSGNRDFLEYFVSNFLEPKVLFLAKSKWRTFSFLILLLIPLFPKSMIVHFQSPFPGLSNIWCWYLITDPSSTPPKLFFNISLICNHYRSWHSQATTESFTNFENMFLWVQSFPKNMF